MDTRLWEIGTIILYKNITTITGKIQRLWWRITRQPYKQYSHLSVYAGESTLGRQLEAEANTQVDQTTFKYTPDNMDLFMPNANQDNVKLALNQAIDAHEETLYGFISWLTIVIRGIFEMLGFKKAKSWNILWGWGVMCSEFGWYYMYLLASYEIRDAFNQIAMPVGMDKVKRLIQKRDKWLAFYQDLHTYNPNTFTPIDARVLFGNHSEIWQHTNILGEAKLKEYEPDNYNSYDLGVLRGYRK